MPNLNKYVLCVLKRCNDRVKCLILIYTFWKAKLLGNLSTQGCVTYLILNNEPRNAQPSKRKVLYLELLLIQ